MFNIQVYKGIGQICQAISWKFNCQFVLFLESERPFYRTENLWWALDVIPSSDNLQIDDNIFTSEFSIIISYTHQKKIMCSPCLFWELLLLLSKTYNQPTLLHKHVWNILRVIKARGKMIKPKKRNCCTKLSWCLETKTFSQKER